MAVDDKNKYGQYFTPKVVADFMVKLLELDKSQRILEPSCGDGVFLSALSDANYKNIEGIEFDATCSLNTKFKIKYADYLQDETTTNSYDGVIGNPPYIRWKNLDPVLKNNLDASSVWKEYCNSLCDYSVAFIAKAILDLKANGTLVFITPEYWLYTFHSQKLRNLIIDNGTIDRIYHLDEASIFDNVNASLMIFRFRKGVKKDTTIWKIKDIKAFDSVQLESLIDTGESENFKKIDALPFKRNDRFSLEPREIAIELNSLEASCVIEKKDLFNSKFHTVGDICDIGNGMVTGLDKAFQITNLSLNKFEKENSIEVAKAKQLDGVNAKSTTPYIFIKDRLTEDEFREKCPNFFTHLQPFKDALLKRYSYDRDINYWEWVFLRNFNAFNKDSNKIFVPCKERLASKRNFRFTLVPSNIFPTQDVTGITPKQGVKESIAYIHMYLISKYATDWIINRGVTRGGVAEFSEAPIASIPFRQIDWNNKFEVATYEKIVALSNNYYEGNNDILDEIESEFKKLLN
jgi:adenine-specific DNA-methyltransferase